MSERLAQIEKHAFKNRNYDVTKLMHNDVEWLIQQAERVQTLEGTNHFNYTQKEHFKNKCQQLESENERLRETLKQIQLKAASPGLSFNDRLTDIQKLALLDGDEE